MRDHDHSSGFIRGLLCDECNIRLGIYEANLRDGRRRGRARYWRWVADYQKQISVHLTRNTGEVYHPASTFAKPDRFRQRLRSRALGERDKSEPPRAPRLRTAISKADVEARTGLERYRRAAGYTAPPRPAKKKKRKKIKTPRAESIARAEETLRDYRERRKLWKRPDRDGR